MHKHGVLKIGADQLHGSIPPCIGNLSRLKTLDVHTNNLIGKIPKELGRLNNIQHIQLSINNLKGIFPGPLYNLSALSFFAFAVNDQHGQIPSDIGSRLPNLRLFHICINKFNSAILPSLHNLPKIESIRMSHNFLSGSLTVLGVLKDCKAWTFQATNCLETYMQALPTYRLFSC
jgi:Leucine-rich repeat (LRR) protein